MSESILYYCLPAGSSSCVLITEETKLCEAFCIHVRLWLTIIVATKMIPGMHMVGEN